ncbi:transmembrane reductase CYB561D2-like [Arctopsyche grandis]|uniref:transmembrane reductase CYB561D2-like n=1 Tax=Arctopsyche grandis TaxID=121162 RepID=UPI00406D74D7
MKLNDSLLSTLKVLLNTLAQMLVGVIFLFIIYYAVRYIGSEKLKLHVIFSTLGYEFLMMEAIMVFNPENSWSRHIPRKNKKIVHLVLQVTAASFILAGFILAVVEKGSWGIGHFTSNHGILGLTSFICTLISIFNGIGTFLMAKSKNRVRSTGVKFMHTLFGSSTIVLGLVTLILGVRKQSFINNAGETLSVVATVFLALSACYVFLNPLLNMKAYLPKLRSTNIW